ncbi:MAG TPA: N-acetylmuramic acid 6-phosphate etherase, partial [Solirubrobacterales bacterium]|nr:N-acetylmuramic acid 6-phosphate etherase [Solirubrobacterales bacterium]
MARNLLDGTEGVRAGDEALSAMSTAALVGTMVADLDAVQESLAAAAPAVTAAIDDVAARMSRGGRLIYVGAGTSGRLAQLDAVECPPTFGTNPERVQALLAGGSGASKLAVEAAEDDEEDAVNQIAAVHPGPEDTVLGLSASGRTPFVLAAMREARRGGALTIGVSCNSSASLSLVVDHPIELIVGEELLSGST